MSSILLTDADLTIITKLLRSNISFKRRAGVVDAPSEKLLNKMIFAAMECVPGACLYFVIGGFEMDDNPGKTPDKRPDAPDPGWIENALNEHHRAYDPDDPITADEAAWMLREMASSDMDYPEEFLRRSA